MPCRVVQSIDCDEVTCLGQAGANVIATFPTTSWLKLNLCEPNNTLLSYSIWLKLEETFY